MEELGTGSGKGTGALVEVDVDGRSGDMVTLGTYGDRMRSRCRSFLLGLGLI